MVHNCVAVIIVVDGSGELDVQAHQKLLLHCRLLALAHLAADEGGCRAEPLHAGARPRLGAASGITVPGAAQRSKNNSTAC